MNLEDFIMEHLSLGVAAFGALPREVGSELSTVGVISTAPSTTVGNGGVEAITTRHSQGR